MRTALMDRVAAMLGLPPVPMTVVGAPGDVAVMTSPDSLPGFRAIYAAAGVPFEIPKIPARVMFQVRSYRSSDTTPATSASTSVTCSSR